MDITTYTPGSFCTSVLRTRDQERAAAFYSALVGWSTQDVPAASDHRLLQFGGRTVASLHQISNGDDVWLPHVSVESVDCTTTDALTLGATLVDSTDVSGLARLTTLRDPEGALFGLWQRTHQGAQLTEDVGSLWWIDVQGGGVLPIGRDWDVSPTWNSIFAMDDCNSTLERVKTLGGPPVFVHTVPKHGRIGSLRDPGGAVFVIRGPVPSSS